jgi:hypothetical protein
VANNSHCIHDVRLCMSEVKEVPTLLWYIVASTGWQVLFLLKYRRVSIGTWTTSSCL